ncbi:hypothetical protein GCM10025868_30330 [Angustibacter aerolatus]|uniref:Ketoreductase (KR) domain-containing protein n=1 Tax=Angustibacter aerolatus TaxID=1162965 RepID=A0ABQ6JK54_9ACTN|nr:hypothetical protein GCM10025868_30330 [Angustibacter aerolatus]
MPVLLDAPLGDVGHPGPLGPLGPLGPQPVVVVSGGARGVTAAVVRDLARRHRPRLLLLGRTELVDEPAGLVGADDEREPGAPAGDPPRCRRAARASPPPRAGCSPSARCAPRSTP